MPELCSVAPFREIARRPRAGGVLGYVAGRRSPTPVRGGGDGAAREKAKCRFGS